MRLPPPIPGVIGVAPRYQFGATFQRPKQGVGINATDENEDDSQVLITHYDYINESLPMGPDDFEVW
jgi:hypothetical protein